MLASVLATFLFATSSVTARQSIQRLGSSSANILRLLVAASLLGLYAHLWGVGFQGPSLPWFLLSGVIGYGVCDTALFMALPRLGARLTSLMVQCLAVPVAAATEWLWLGTRLGPREILASLTILAGVTVALLPDQRRVEPKGTGKTLRPGFMAFVFGGIAAVGQGLGAVISKHGQSLSREAGFPIDPFSVSYQRIVAGVVFGGVWWWIQFRRNTLDRPPAVAIRQNPGVPTLVWVLINGLSGPCLGVAAYQWALKHEPTGVVLSVTSLTPVAVIPISRWIDGDRASRRSLIGGAVAVAGVVALALNR